MCPLIALTLIQAAKLLTTIPLLTPTCTEILFFHRQYPNFVQTIIYHAMHVCVEDVTLGKKATSVHALRLSAEKKVCSRLCYCNKISATKIWKCP